MAALASSCEDLSSSSPEKSSPLFTFRAPSNHRESVRRQLASTHKDCDSDEDEDSASNLSICFLNEALCEDDEDLSAHREPVHHVNGALSVRNSSSGGKNSVLERLTSQYIAQNNISRKKNHVIIPLGNYQGCERGTPKDEGINTEDLLETSSDVLQRSGLDGDLRPDPLHNAEESAFALYLYKIRVDAKQRLDLARTSAQEELGWPGREHQLLDENLSRLCGIAHRRRLDRHSLTAMSTGHLQVILNYFLSRVEELNENLVQYLITRDELIMEQDSILTDVEDITKGISL